MVHCYFISGLGADHTVFSRLQLRKDIVVHHLEWLDPLPEEDISDYAMRMSADITDPKNAVLIGLSFGGIMAIEIGKRVPVKKIILISSVKNKEEMPLTLNLIGLFNLHKLLHDSKLLHFSNITAWFFGIRQGPQKLMFESLLAKSEEDLVDWSTDKILSWQGSHQLNNIIHVHGTADTVFPIRNIVPDKAIKGGPHFMVYTHAEQVSAWLNKVIDTG